MKIIAIAAVTAGGKTTAVNGIKHRLKNTQSLHFDDYSFEAQLKIFTNGLLTERIIMFGI